MTSEVGWLNRFDRFLLKLNSADSLQFVMTDNSCFLHVYPTYSKHLLILYIVYTNLWQDVIVTLQTRVNTRISGIGAMTWQI